MSFLEEIREGSFHMFSKLEIEVLKYLERCPWGVTIYQIARDIGCSFKSLYSVLKLFEKNDWLLTIKERNGSIGRPRNKYILKQSLRTIIRELQDCGCKFENNGTKILNLMKISYPHSLIIFKRALAKMKYGQCLITLLDGTTNCQEFIETASKKDIKMLDISTDNHKVRIILKKT